MWLLFEVVNILIFLVIFIAFLFSIYKLRQHPLIILMLIEIQGVYIFCGSLHPMHIDKGMCINIDNIWYIEQNYLKHESIDNCLPKISPLINAKKNSHAHCTFSFDNAFLCITSSITFLIQFMSKLNLSFANCNYDILTKNI